MSSTLQQKFFQLIRYSLHPDAPVPDIHSEEEWRAIYDMASKQCIVGILGRGMERMPQEQKPNQQLSLKWVGTTVYIQNHNLKAYHTIRKVKNHLEKDGWECCILKGQSNALIYPDGFYRSTGDIDVWVRRKGVAQSQEQRAAALIAYARLTQEHPKCSYHHVDYNPCDGIEVEMHYRPSFMFRFKHNRKLQQWMEAHADEQFTHLVEMPDGEGSIAIPTRQFNAVFQLSHLAHHFLHEGVGLRQLLDYYFQIRTDEHIEIPSDLGLDSFLSAVMYILQEVFGLEDKYLLIKPNAKLGKFVLNEIILGGNFGKYDKRILTDTKANAFTKNIQRTYRDLRTALYFPSESLSEPVFRLWHYLWRMKHR